MYHHHKLSDLMFFIFIFIFCILLCIFKDTNVAVNTTVYKQIKLILMC
jgi:hypothetical protein